MSQSLVEVIICIGLFLILFEYFYRKASIINPGTQLGIGFAAIIGLLGIVLRHWDWQTGIAVCMVGGFIGCAKYRLEKQRKEEKKEEEEDEEERSRNQQIKTIHGVWKLVAVK